eukprot:11440533-Alexandrium_andersonii.AAC.1
MATWPSASMTQHLAASASASRAGSPPAPSRTICEEDDEELRQPGVRPEGLVHPGPHPSLVPAGCLLGARLAPRHLV